MQGRTDATGSFGATLAFVLLDVQLLHQNKRISYLAKSKSCSWSLADFLDSNKRTSSNFLVTSKGIYKRIREERLVYIAFRNLQSN